MTQTCDNCQKTGPTVKKCGRCKHTFYCSKACQKQDWADHKWICFPESEGRQLYTHDESDIVWSRPVEDLIDTSRFPTGLVEVRDDPVRGRGVYAKKDIPSGVKICFDGGFLKVGLRRPIQGNKVVLMAPTYDVNDSSCAATSPTDWTGVKTDSLPPSWMLQNEDLMAFFQTSDTVTHSLGIGQFIRLAGQLKPDESNINDCCKVIDDAEWASNCKYKDIFYETTKPVSAGQELTNRCTTAQTREALMLSKKPESRWMYVEVLYDPKDTDFSGWKEQQLYEIMHLHCGFPWNFLAKRDVRMIISVLRRKIKGRDDYYHMVCKEKVDIKSLIERLLRCESCCE